MSLPLIAIVGRPNVGKSLLFNRLVGKRISIVEDTPGVTRDRIYAECDWAGRVFRLADTGGIEPHTGDEMLKFMRAQAELAASMADVIVLVVDVQTGVTAADADVADMLLKRKKPIVLAVNKCDRAGPATGDVYEFYNLGVGEPIPVSAVHGSGTGDLLDACVALLPPEDEYDAEPDGIINVAVIGKPNVGKSSLVNRILGEERTIVSDIPGTTRDAIDSYFENDHGCFNFIDTAGLRKHAKVDESIEKYSVLRTVMAVERADVCLIMIDAAEGITEQDTKVAGLAHDSGKAAIIVVNKWDSVEKETGTYEAFEKKVRIGITYMDYAPVTFISALTGKRVDTLFEQIIAVYANARKRVTTGQLNQVLTEAVARMQPPTKKGKRLRIYYITQTGICPPNFVAFCNDSELFHFSYRRYLENRIRDAYGFEGTPLRIIVKQRGEGD